MYGQTGAFLPGARVPLRGATGREWIEWTRDVGRSRGLSIAVDSTAQSTVFYTLFNDNIQRQGAYGLLGTRVDCGPSHRGWTIRAYARNLTSTDYVNATFGHSGDRSCQPS